MFKEEFKAKYVDKEFLFVGLGEVDEMPGESEEGGKREERREKRAEHHKESSPRCLEMQVHFTKYTLKEASAAVRFPYPIPPLRD